MTYMPTWLMYFSFSLALITMELLYFRIARDFKILDHPNNRSLHEKPTIRGGGIIFYLSALLFYALTFQPDLPFIIGMTLVSVIGFADDIRSLSSTLRFAFQSLAFGIAFSGFDIDASPWLLAAMFIVSVGAINTFNFMDGINGLTGGYGLVALLSLLFVNIHNVSFTESDFILAVIASVLVFCYFNFRKKAVCFAGDVGSLSIGFVIIFMIVRLILISDNFVFVFFLTVYGVDSVLTIIHRLMRRENIFKAHRLHFFQIVVNSGKVSHIQMSIIYMVLQALINIAVIASLTLPLSSQYIIGFGIVLLLGMAYVIIKPRAMTPHP